MCFSPQRCAIFRHRNFKKVLGHGHHQFFNILIGKCAFRHSLMQFFDDVFCTFWLGNVLLATASCNVSTSELQKVVRSWRVLCIFPWKCENSVHFLISPRTTWLFYELTFWFTRHTNHWKNTAFRDFSNTWRMCIFFRVTLRACWSSFLWLDFSGLLFICFSTLHIVGSLPFIQTSFDHCIQAARHQKKSWGLASCHGNLSGRRSGEYSQHATLSMACTGDHDYCGLWRLLPNIFGRREGRERGRTRKTKKTEKFLLAMTGRARIYDLIEWEVILYCSPMHFLVFLKYLKDTHMIPVSRCTRNKRDWSVAVHANCT